MLRYLFGPSKLAQAESLLRTGTVSDEDFQKAARLLREYYIKHPDEETRSKITALLEPYGSMRLDSARIAIREKKFEDAQRILEGYLRALPNNPIALVLMRELPLSDSAAMAAKK